MDTHPPPQDALVKLAYAGEEEAGRYAIAAANIAPGRAVLVAAPHTLVFNPNEFVSALYLATKAVPADGTHDFNNTNSNNNNNNNSKGGKQGGNKKKTAKAAPAAAEGASDSLGQPHAITAHTWCSGCFQRIEPGTPLLNHSALLDLAIDVSIEQQDMEDALSHQINNNNDGDDDAEEHEDEEAMKKRQKAAKKPTKSAKMKKDSAVALKQKMRDMALLQRESLIFEHRQKKKDAAAAGAPRDICSYWTGEEEDTNTAKVAGAVGCEGCGIVSYCSARCYRESHLRHAASGECATLRCMYPIIMREYYTSLRDPAAGVMRPGDEAKHWTRSTSEEKSLEAQALMLQALLLASSSREGYAAHWSRVEEPGIKQGGTGEDDQKEQALEDKTSAKPAPVAATTTTTAAAAAMAAMAESVIVPKEVLSMQQARAQLGLTGTVELMDSDPGLAASLTFFRNSDADSVVADDECIWVGSVAAPLELDENDTPVFHGSNNSTGNDNNNNNSMQQKVRIPRYADIAQMVTNLSVLSKDRKGVYSRYYRKFCKLILPRMLQFGSTVLSSDFTVEKSTAAADVISESYFIRVCAAAQCNSFGVYTPGDRCLAFGMYPEASYFNHSCKPNLCRVMTNGGRTAAFYALCPIKAGEPLSICYTDVQEKNSAERRRNILGTYRFFCQCVRCGVVAAGGGGGDCNDKQAEVPLCAECQVRGYLRPIVPSAAVRSHTPEWGMADVSLFICTMCGKKHSNQVPL